MALGNFSQKTFLSLLPNTSRKAPSTAQRHWRGLTIDFVGSYFSGESIFISVSFRVCSAKGSWCMQ